MRSLILALVCMLLALPLKAEEAPAPVLRVGVAEVAPFVMRGEDGGWRGISIELWEQVAELAGLRFEYQPMAYDELLPSLEQGRLDLVVGTLIMTAEHERAVDFSHPYYHTGLAIAVSRDSGGWGALRSLFSWQFLSLVLGLAGLLLAVGTVLWFFEREHNRAQFGESPAEGLGNGFWLAAVTMTTVGYGDKAPVTLGGRLVALIWMFSALVMVSTFTAAITSTLTVGSLRNDIQGPDDLRGVKVASVPHTASAHYLEERRISPVAYADLPAAMRAVQNGEADAVVYEKPLLQYHNADVHAGGLVILRGTFDNQSYAFALAAGSPYREVVNRQVLRITDSPYWRALLASYLGKP